MMRATRRVRRHDSGSDDTAAAKTPKRSGQWLRLALDERVRVSPPPDIDVLALDQALTRPAGFDPKSQVAEMMAPCHGGRLIPAL